MKLLIFFAILPGQLRRAVFSLALLGLGACGLAPPQPHSNPQWQARQTQLQALQSWDLSASIAAHSQQEGFDARLHWRQSPQSYTLRIIGPLGQGAVVLEGGPGQVVLHTAEGRDYYADNPDALLEKISQVRLPLQAMDAWVRGLPSPGLAVQRQEVDEDGRLLSLRQDGWEVQYARYQAVEGLELPVKFTMQNAEYYVKVVVSAWRL